MGAITWSVIPAIGAFSVTGASSSPDPASSLPVFIAKGTYQAPSTVLKPQAVTLVAKSIADPTVTASATIFLGATVGIAVTPASVSLSPGQSASFTASIAGTLNTSVSWSLDSPVGTIANGVYTAPVTINALQTVILTVASLADPSKTATATIVIRPSDPILIQVSPPQVTLQPSQAQQFTASVHGSSSTLSWSISPMVGSISPDGLYTPPEKVSDGQLVTVRATLASNPPQTATAQITLAGVTPPPPLPPIQLPVEVIGLDGTTSTVSFNIPQGANLNGPIKLLMQIHGLEYQTEASVQINGSGWTPINSATVALLGRAAAYGGIGGGFSTLQMTLPVPLSAISVGTNNLSFRFNGTDGTVSGFRVLSFNFLAGDGSSLLPETAFVYEDPNTWQPPSTAASDIAAGKSLWYSAPLSIPTVNGPTSIQAKCTNCHAQDGRDLKYFNYSNNSIRTRAMFHGLTAQQGDQIASYIRTLNAPNPGRPWNPPYQPGPGLDSRPVEDWSAGAGLEAVLDTDDLMLQYLMPAGSTTTWQPTAYLNLREMPVAFQLPDWNHWLPTIHPRDAWGPSFTSSTLFTNYQNIRSTLHYQDAQSYLNAKDSMAYWGLYDSQFVGPLLKPQTDPSWANPAYVRSLYSTRQWSAVKWWELNHEFGLEGMAQTVFGSQAASRAWNTAIVFFVGPHGCGMPAPAPGIGTGTNITYDYFSFVWYHVQLLLNDGNGQAVGTYPVDFPYSYGPLTGMSWHSPVSPQPGAGALLTAWLVKAGQMAPRGKGPEYGSLGWSPGNNDVSQMIKYPSEVSIWNDMTSAQSNTVINAFLQIWLAQVTSFTPQQFYAGGAASTTETIILNPEGSFGDRVANMIPQFLYHGADASLIGRIATWAQTVWPQFNWPSALNATCSRAGAGQAVVCVPAS